MTLLNEADNIYLNGQLASKAYVGSVQVWPYIKLWSPADLGTSLLVWLDAADAATITITGSGVSQWRDKSSYGRHLNQSSDPTRPTYVTNKIQMYNQKALAPAVAYPGNAYDYILVGKSVGVGQYHSLLLTTSGSHLAFVIDPSDLVGVYTDGFYQVVGITWVPGTDAFIYGSISTGSSTSMAKNGGSLTQRTITFLEPTLYFLGQPNYPQGFGDLYEFIIVPFNSLIDVRQKLEGYLAWKWNLQNLLPANHPYKLAAP